MLTADCAVVTLTSQLKFSGLAQKASRQGAQTEKHVHIKLTSLHSPSYPYSGEGNKEEAA